ncbi:MAG: ABC transporter ATP-binding protein [Chitinophagaceae bacterium]
MNHLKAIRKYLWKYRLRLFAGILFIIASNYFGVLPPQLTSFVVDKVQRIIEHHPTAPVPRQTDPLINFFIDWTNRLSYGAGGIVVLCGLAIMAMALLRGLFMFFMRQTIIVMSRYIEFDQKNEVYSHYQQLDTQFYKTHSTGDLMNRIAEDVSKVRMYTGPAIMYLINLLTTIIFTVGNMAASQPRLTLYVLTPLPILAITIYYVNTIIHRKSEKIQELLSDLTTNAQQSYSGIRVIKSYVQEKAMLNYFNRNSEAYRESAIGLAKVEAIYFPSMFLMIGISTLVTILMGGLFLHDNNVAAAAGLAKPHPGLDVGVIVAFIMYINMLTFPVSAIGWVASMIQRASASQKRINEFLNTKPTIVSPPSAAELVLHGRIDFNQVNFTYPHTGIKALQDFSVHIKAGDRIAVIGKTGSGKSTVAQLLLRMYDALSGTILLDGKPLTAIDLQSLRRQISYVPQDVFLFSETVENNIKFGNEKASHADAVAAANMASVAAEIDHFEHGYETMVGERGVTLSGGQKQRLSIARALLKPSAITIFDDCLSAVDARTEKAVLNNLDKQLKGKTAIIITHRIFSMMHFDNIIVMDDGRIVESGTHENLLAANGAYAELYSLQQEVEEEG